MLLFTSSQIQPFFFSSSSHNRSFSHIILNNILIDAQLHLNSSGDGLCISEAGAGTEHMNLSRMLSTYNASTKDKKSSDKKAFILEVIRIMQILACHAFSGTIFSSM